MRLILTCAAVALLAGPAAAGPIEWSYKTEVSYDRDYGDRFVVTADPGRTVQTADGDVTGYWLFSSVANPRPLPGEYEARYGFLVNVTITDLASGASATQGFPGGYSSMWAYPESEKDNPDVWRWEWEDSYFGEYWNPWVVRLGNVEYTVRAFGGGNGMSPNGEMTVRPDAVATPEPTTLALAGLGLGVLGLARRRMTRCA
jgi:hypothetical protein